MKITTVTGPIDTRKLGYCQCHEHLFIRKGKPFEINSVLWMDDLLLSAAELSAYKSAGGCSLVDAQPVGCGRMPEYLAEASRIAGVSIVASTGFHKLVYYNNNHWIHEMDEDSLTRLFISELETGMYTGGDTEPPDIQSDIKAGIIKTAVDSSGIEGRYSALFSAAAIASRATGSSILCHIEKGADAVETADFLLKRGVKPCSLILCHLDRVTCDLQYHRELAGMGVFLEYDTISRFKYHDNDTEIGIISAMVEMGCAGRILLGLDTTRERLRSYGGSTGLDHILDSFIPLMLQAGIPMEDIEKMTVGNPQMALSIKNQYEEL